MNFKEWLNICLCVPFRGESPIIYRPQKHRTLPPIEYFIIQCKNCLFFEPDEYKTRFGMCHKHIRVLDEECHCRQFFNCVCVETEAER